MSPSSIRMYSGTIIDLAAPDHRDIHIADIARHLSRINRYTGAVDYSVAQHSVLLYEMLGTREALLHDAHEAYIGDVSTPLKTLLPGYVTLEQRWVETMSRRFKLNGTQLHFVHYFDKAIGVDEMRCLLNVDAPVKVARNIKPWTPDRAEAEFLNSYAECCE